MKVSLKEVAKEIGVSAPAISLYLNHDPRSRLSRETRIKIDEAVVRLGYRPSPLARAVRTGRNNILGLVCSTVTDPYYSHILEACIRFCDRHGYQLQFSMPPQSQTKEFQALASLLDCNPIGIFFLNALVENPENLELLGKSSVPIVFLNQSVSGLRCVYADYSDSAVRALNFLKERGHRKLAFYGFGAVAMKTPQVEQICRENHITCELQEDFSPKDIPELLEKRPDAIYLTNGHIVRILTEQIDRRHLDYAPEIVTNYNLEHDFWDDPRIVGIIDGSFYAMVHALLDNLSEKKGTELHTKIPTFFHPVSDFRKRLNDIIDNKEKYEQAYLS